MNKSPEETYDLISTGGEDYHGATWLKDNIYVAAIVDEDNAAVNRTGYGPESRTYDLELDSVTYTISVDASGRVRAVTNDA